MPCVWCFITNFPPQKPPIKPFPTINDKVVDYTITNKKNIMNNDNTQIIL